MAASKPSAPLVPTQQRFAWLFGQLVTYVYKQGWALTLDECYRPPELAKLYASQGRGIANSLHTQRLAVDLNLWHGENLCTHGAEYEPLGVWWEGLDPQCRWGGRFTTADYRHFSVAWDGHA